MIWNFEIYEIPIIDIAKYEAGSVIAQSIVALAIAVRFSLLYGREARKSKVLCFVSEKTRALNKTACDLEAKNMLEKFCVEDKQMSNKIRTRAVNYGKNLIAIDAVTKNRSAWLSNLAKKELAI